MQWMIDGAVLVALILIIYQDYSGRAVSWPAFPVLALLLTLKSMMKLPMDDLMTGVFINITFIALQMGILMLYFSIKKSKLTGIIGPYLGWGDVLFLLCAAFAFSLLNFIVFYVAGLALALILAALQALTRTKRWDNIPLAGIQALLMAIILLTDHFLSEMDLFQGNLFY